MVASLNFEHIDSTDLILLFDRKVLEQARLQKQIDSAFKQNMIDICYTLTDYKLELQEILEIINLEIKRRNITSYSKN